MDYPLPNTGLAYSQSKPGKGEKWWSRDGNAGSPSDRAAVPHAQPGMAAPGLDMKALGQSLAKSLAGVPRLAQKPKV